MKNVKYIQKLLLSGVLMLMMSQLYAQPVPFTFTSSPILPLTDNACNLDFSDGQGPETDVLMVSGLATPLDGATVTLDSVNLNVTHTWVGDLQVSLLAPDGITRITLMSRPGDNNNAGFGTSGDDMDLWLHAAGTNGTTDVEDPGSDLCNGDAVPGPPPCLIGSWIPTEPLTLQENGQDPNGNWTLEICDAAGGDEGVLNSWSLNFTSPPPPPPIPTMGQWGIIILGLMMVIIGLVAAFSWHRKTNMAG